MNFTEEKNSKGRWVRKCEYKRITLKDALKFNDDDWCQEFFKSFDNMHQKHKGKFLLFEWDVCESKLSDTKVKWTLIANRGGYDPEERHQSFESKLNEDFTPSVFDSTKHSERGSDIVMICPGKGDGTGTEGSLHGLGNGRCTHVTNYMCSGKTEYEEKKTLWKLVGKTAMRRMDGTLRRYGGYYKNGQRGNIADIDKNGHEKLHISTHGFGVPWLHVRVESKPEYPDQANY